MVSVVVAAVFLVMIALTLTGEIKHCCNKQMHYASMRSFFSFQNIISNTTTWTLHESIKLTIRSTAVGLSLVLSIPREIISLDSRSRM